MRYSWPLSARPGERPPRRASAAATAPSLRQCEHVELIAQPRLQLRGQAHEAERQTGAARADGDVLLAAHGERDRVAVDGRAEIDLPEHVARALVVGTEAAVSVAAEQEAAGRRHERQLARALLALPNRGAGAHVDRLDDSDLVGARCNLHFVAQRVRD